MIINSLKSFLKNLLLIFVPMGIIYFLLVLSIFVFTTHVIHDASVLFNKASELIGTTVVSHQDQIQTFIRESINSVNTGNWLDTVKNILNVEFMTNLSNGIINILADGKSEIIPKLSSEVNEFASNFNVSLSLVYTTIIFSFSISYIVTLFLVKRNQRREIKFKKLAVYFIIESLTTALYFVITYILYSISKAFIIPVLIIVILLHSITTLFNAWFIQGKGVIKLKEIINIKKIVALLLSYLIVFIIALLLLIIFFFLTNTLFVALLLAPILIYTLVIISSVSESYVRSVKDKKLKESKVNIQQQNNQ